MTTDDHDAETPDEPDSSRTDKHAGLTIGRLRLRYIIVGVVTAIWVVDVLTVIVVTVLFERTATPQPTVASIFTLVVAWVLGIELGILSRFDRKDRQ